jgi:4-hydroxy-3-methylbut-2-enyl diphosphate reductase IspH
MEIIVGKMVGFCSGVQRAIEGVKNELTKNEKLYCLGEIIPIISVQFLMGADSPYEPTDFRWI